MVNGCLEMADMRIEFSGITLKNPIIVASAEPSNSVENIKQCIDYGAGAVITKTIGDIPGMQLQIRNLERSGPHHQRQGAAFVHFLFPFRIHQ